MKTLLLLFALVAMVYGQAMRTYDYTCIGIMLKTKTAWANYSICCNEKIDPDFPIAGFKSSMEIDAIKPALEAEIPNLVKLGKTDCYFRD